MTQKLAIVFGGSRGIGAASVQTLVRDGFQVAWTYVSRRPDTPNSEQVRAYKADLFKAGKTDEALQRAGTMSPFNRVGQPGEVAEIVSFLASDRASWVHGQIVQPNGGMV